ncbi:hypothetical protein ACQJ0Y_07840 [Peribacillus simplex]|uniref:hypothetical protein n=1 Tax=Peribacillus simplex TaxID=1478 RepID=UPI003CF8FAE9
MIKGHFMMGPRLVILIKGIDIESPQVLNEVNNIAFGQYDGKFAELAVIAEDQSSKVFTGI